ncbi:MAG: YqjK family protein [Ramlibacter sp.]|nr:YqjK family protein [Ramlibacter sp.]
MAAHRQAQLQVRRDALAARSHVLRERLAAETLPLQHTLVLADTARDRLKWLMSHPQWVAGIVAIPMLLRPRRAMAWALKLWWGWRAMRRLQALLPPVRP